MFLKVLNKEQKENFLELAYLLARCGYHFEEPEETMLQEFRYEMHLDENNYTIAGKELDEILKIFENCQMKIKLSVFIELIALVLCDSEYDKKEKEVISIIKERFGISEQKCTEVIDWVTELRNIYKKGEEILINL